MDAQIATLINFSTNEENFLAPCIEEAKKFSAQILVSCADHFFDGTIEDLLKLQAAYRQHSEVQFIEFAYDPARNFYGKHPSNFWHNWGRLIGCYFLKPEIEYLLFLDVDEIVDAVSFLQWIEGVNLKNFSALRLACYWYFREPIYQALTWEDTPLWVQRKNLAYETLMHASERAGTFSQISGEKRRFVKGMDGFPMVHHYSWVRTKEQMLRKVQSWGHRHERDWLELVEKEFANEFSGKDFVHGYDFLVTKARFAFGAEKKTEKKLQKMENVRYLNTDEIHRIMMQLCL